MSHIGSKDIRLPNNVTVDIFEKILLVKGELGKLNIEYKNVNIKLMHDEDASFVHISPIVSTNKKRTLESYRLWGTYRTLINNMIIGVSQGYTKAVELVGVGYKATLSEKYKLVLKVGNSIDLYYNIPQDIIVDCPRPNIIIVSGIDKQRVNQVTANIRAYRKPEPYKGKGIRYIGEIVRTKEGKKK